jgi:predicted ArsR family transcriptional regulator
MAKYSDKQAKTTKAARITTLLLRSSGATVAEMARRTGWQPHSVRGFMSGALKRRHGFVVTSKVEDGKPRRYFLARGAS